MEREQIQEYFDRLAELEEERSPWEAHWKEIQEYILPDSGFFSREGQQPNRGEKRRSKIINGVAEEALDRGAAGMQMGLTSPSRPWFRLTLADAELAGYGPVREWLDYVEQLMYRLFSKSNFYAAVMSLYADILGFGIACLYEEESPTTTIWFRPCAVGEYCIAEGHNGLVDTLYRRYWMTVKNAATSFGIENLSETRRNQVDGSPYEWMEVLHVVQPRRERDSDKLDRLNMPYESVYLEMGNLEKPLWVGGYEEFPYFVPRWNTSGPDVYGRSQAMKVLSDVKMLNEIEKTTLKALHKHVDPPMSVPSGFKGVVSLLPGAINYIDTQTMGRAEPLYQVSTDFGGVEQRIARIELSIRRAFFNDIFLMLTQSDNPQMTAREVMERHEEKLILGPFIDRHSTEFHDRVIDRTFGIMVRRGMVPPPPQEIIGQDLKVDYVSILAQAQRMIGTQSIRAAADFVAGLAQFKPEVLDKFNADEAVDQFAEMVGVPAKVILPDDRVQEMRAARQKLMEEQKQAEAAMNEIGAAKTLSETRTEEGNVLGDLLSGLGM